MPTPKSSLSTTSPPPSSPHHLPSDPSIIHPPVARAANKSRPPTHSLTIKVSDPKNGAVPGVLHLPYDFKNQNTHKTAAILLSGAGGGLVGPSSIYLGIATKLSSLKQGIPVLRLDYRYPARNGYCAADVLAAMDYLEREYKISRFVLIGWSFGGAPVFTVAGEDERVVGCATVASQTAGTEGIERLAPRPVLLLHGKSDRTLGFWCSESLFRRYGEGGERELRVFEGDDHALRGNAKVAEEMLCWFVMRCAGVEGQRGGGELVGEDVVGDGERMELMGKGGDLRGKESVE
ncbi:MAG: hypothetical protein Q9192_005219 [Flavoplaca navasiana]